MKAKLLKLWSGLLGSFWMIPALMAAAGAAGGVAVVLLDQRLDQEVVDHLPWLFQGGADSARAILSVIASSTITVLGVAFSVILVALALTSNQYTPRVLYTFISDRGNQAVMGIFIANFTYALIVMRSVRSTDEGLFVPAAGVTGGIALALAAVAALIYFIHHISLSIRASHIVVNISRSTRGLIDEPFPTGVGRPLDAGPTLPVDWAVVPAERSGYVQIVDGSSLIETATDADVVLRMRRGPGDFVVRHNPLLEVAPPERCSGELAKSLSRAIVLGGERTMEQDAEFGVRQLMDIAVKALSPGISDPTTASACIDQLAALLARAAELEDPSPWRGDEHGNLRLIARGPTFASLIEHSFNQIRQHARGDVAVTLRLFEALTAIAVCVRDDRRRELLWRQALMLGRHADEDIEEEDDRVTYNERATQLAGALHRDRAALELILPESTPAFR